jgi:hypothetical protein
MKMAIIAPNDLLEDCALLSSYHLILAHEYIKNTKYKEFYNYRSFVGDNIILDNGAFENNESILLEKLVEITTNLAPTTVIMPDSRFNSKTTLERTALAVKAFKNRGVRLMGVPQGNNKEDVLNCYNELLKIQEIDSIGIYEEIGDVTGLGTRADFCEYLEKHNLVEKNIYYHALGMEENLANAVKLNKFRWLEGIDSAKPIVYGLNNLSVLRPENYERYPHRPESYFTTDYSDLPKDIRMTCVRNCMIMKEAFEKGGTEICAL